MRRPLLPAVLLVAVAALGVGACGGSSESSSDDEAQITDAINAAAVSGDPSSCTEAETQAFVEQVNYEQGQAAIQACRQSAGEGNADSVEVSDIQVDGDGATADVAVTGSTFDGQTIAVSLVKEDGKWKLDSFDDFVSFNPQKFAASFIDQVKRGSQLTPQQVSCLENKIGSASPGTIKQAILSGDSSQVQQLFAGC
jgi:hypothetical protein